MALGTAHARRSHARRAVARSFRCWAESTASTFRLIHISTKARDQQRERLLTRCLGLWYAVAIAERKARAEAEVVKLRGEQSVAQAARAAAEVRTATFYTHVGLSSDFASGSRRLGRARRRRRSTASAAPGWSESICAARCGRR